MGKKKKTTVVHNPSYNDKWIHDRFASDAAEWGNWRTDAQNQRDDIRDDLTGLTGQLGDLRTDVYSDLESGFSQSQQERDKLWQSLDDLSQREVQWGDVQGLEEQLQSIIGQSTTADDALKELMRTEYTSKSEFDTAMRSNLDALQQSLHGQFDLGIGNLESAMGQQYSQTQSQLAALGALGQDERAAIQARLESGEQIGEDERRKLEQKLTADLTSKYAELGGRLGSGLSGLQSTFETDIGAVRTALGEGLSALTGKQVELDKLSADERARIQEELETSTTLSAAERNQLEARLTDDLSGVKEAFGDYRAQTQQQFGDVDVQFKAYQDDLTREGLRTDAAISDVYRTREEGIADLNKAWGQQLQTQENVLSDRIAEGRAEMNRRLTDISSTMNYRTLGDSALGIRSRRSKAFRTGASSTGTGQLARGSRVNTLNIA
jgi:hypothetical protein